MNIKLTAKQQEYIVEGFAEWLETRANDPWPDKHWPAANEILLQLALELRGIVEDGDCQSYLA